MFLAESNSTDLAASLLSVRRAGNAASPSRDDSDVIALLVSNFNFFLRNEQILQIKFTTTVDVFTSKVTYFCNHHSHVFLRFSVVDLGDVGDAGPHHSNFFSFSCSFQQKLCKIIG